MRRKMFLHLLLRSLRLRRRHTWAALLALVVCASVATALLSLYLDLETKLNHEFRSFGANILVTSTDSLGLSLEAAEKTLQQPDAIVVPSNYAVVAATDETPVVLVGSDLAKQKRLNSWWKVSRWPDAAQEALVGQRALRTLGLRAGDAFHVTFQGKPLDLKVGGTLQTGGPEDNRIYVSATDFRQLSAAPPQALEISFPGSAQQVQTQIDALARALPSAHVSAIRQVAEAETRVIGRTRSLMLGAMLVIALTVALCILATLTSSIFERRKDFALMKALGSTQRMLNILFGCETLILGILGGTAGFAIGCLVAALIGQMNFHAAIWPQPVVLALVVPGSCALALLGAVTPLLQLQNIQPASMLKGE